MLKNCAGCNRIFSHPTRNLCQDCYEEAQQSFESVRGYLKENPGASVVEVANDTGVDLDLIYEYIEEGRLDVVPKDVRLRCSICGESITIGRVCPKCRNELRSTIAEEKDQVQGVTRQTSRVHTFDNIRKR